MLLVIDNYDSFTYNLVQYFQQLGQEVVVYRNDEISLTDIQVLDPQYICISPGPGTPDQAGICSISSNNFPAYFPFLAYVWDTKPLPGHLERKLLLTGVKCTAKHHWLIIITKGFFALSPTL